MTAHRLIRPLILLAGILALLTVHSGGAAAAEADPLAIIDRILDATGGVITIIYGSAG